MCGANLLDMEPLVFNSREELFRVVPRVLELFQGRGLLVRRRAADISGVSLSGARFVSPRAHTMSKMKDTPFRQSTWAGSRREPCWGPFSEWRRRVTVAFERKKARADLAR